MTLSDYEYRKIIDYLEEHTTYDIGDLVTKSDHQLYAMKKRISEAMITYPREIYNYYMSHPTYTPRYTLEQLRQMKYNELSEIRQTLKIRKPSKVKSATPSIDTAAKAKETIKSQTTTETVKNIITSNFAQDEKEHDELSFITRAEAIAMYGEDISDEYLEARGFKLYEPFTQPESDAEERYILIDEIGELDISLKGVKLTPADLIKFETEELHYLYHLGCRIEEEFKKQKRLQK